MSLKNLVGIVGAAQTVHVRKRDDVNVAELAREGAELGLADAGLDWPDIDAVVIASGPVLMEGINHPELWVGNELDGMRDKPIWRVTSGGNTGASGAIAAMQLVASGRFETVLALGYEKQSDGQTQYAISSLYDPIVGRPYAAGIMAYCAAYNLARFEPLGHTEQMAAEVVVKNHRNGLRNDRATQARADITVADVMASPPLSWPIKQLDCPPISDGAAAVIVSSAERCAQSGRGVAWVHAAEQIAEAQRYPNRQLVLPEVGAAVVHRAYREANITDPLHDLDLAEVYVAFSFEELIHYELLGLCHRGHARAFLESGAPHFDGAFPVNPSGGVLVANPIGASAMIRTVEVARQVLQRAGEHQVPHARKALAHGYGGWNSHHSIVIVSSDRPE